ncbi:MAG: 3'(2'),5'-bisphosphate nucleotidase CysQ [Kineothrix sp.]|nr:3'(2'),5'-bisphosphate nucleotidase CysQ [Kineothrix sp.]
MWDKERETAKQCAVKAGGKILEIYNSTGGTEVEYKEDNSPLTRADKASNQIIVEILKREFPAYALLSEEEKDEKGRLANDYCFIVDPLDGTKEFIKQNGQFTVNIALSYRHKTVMGVIYVPVTGELYYASEGDGAFLETRNGKIRKLSVSDNKDIPSLRFVVSNSHGCKEMDELIEKYQITDFVKVGSSLKGCMVAAGQADVYYRFNPTMEWDTAAMQCIAEEAGAVFRQMDGTRMCYNRENSLNEKGFYILNCNENLLV